MHRKSVCFVKSVRGAEPMEKAPPARPLPGFRFLRTCSFLVYPRVLWITGLAFLRKESPLAAAERPSVASQ